MESVNSIIRRLTSQDGPQMTVDAAGHPMSWAASSMRQQGLISKTTPPVSPPSATAPTAALTRRPATPPPGLVRRSSGERHRQFGARGADDGHRRQLGRRRLHRGGEAAAHPDVQLRLPAAGHHPRPQHRRPLRRQRHHPLREAADVQPRQKRREGRARMRQRRFRLLRGDLRPAAPLQGGLHVGGGQEDAPVRALLHRHLRPRVPRLRTQPARPGVEAVHRGGQLRHVSLHSTALSYTTAAHSRLTFALLSLAVSG